MTHLDIRKWRYKNIKLHVLCFGSTLQSPISHIQGRKKVNPDKVLVLTKSSLCCLKQWPSVLLVYSKKLWHKYLHLPKLIDADLLSSLWLFTSSQKFYAPCLMVLALIENSSTFVRISWPTRISYGFKKVSIFAVKHKPLSKYLKMDEEWILYKFSRLGNNWLHILPRHGAVKYDDNI